MNSRYAVSGLRGSLHGIYRIQRGNKRKVEHGRSKIMPTSKISTMRFNSRINAVFKFLSDFNIHKKYDEIDLEDYEIEEIRETINYPNITIRKPKSKFNKDIVFTKENGKYKERKIITKKKQDYEKINEKKQKEIKKFESKEQYNKMFKKHKNKSKK